MFKTTILNPTTYILSPSELSGKCKTIPNAARATRSASRAISLEHVKHRSYRVWVLGTKVQLSGYYKGVTESYWRIFQFRHTQVLKGVSHELIRLVLYGHGIRRGLGVYELYFRYLGT